MSWRNYRRTGRFTTETKGPDLAKPSAIHVSLDFGDVVGMDGIIWTNKAGRQFFFYHIVDQGTTFHTAIHTKSHSTKDAIEALTKGWISWAGPRSGRRN